MSTAHAPHHRGVLQVLSMAIALPPDHHATRPHETPPEPDGYRLPGHHQRDLRDVARGVEETRAGIATRYLPEGDGALGDHVPLAGALHDLERWCDSCQVWSRGAETGREAPWRRRIERARAALHRLERAGDLRSAAVLHVAYGHPDPIVRTWTHDVLRVVGEPALAPLLRYTDAVEERRRAMVRAATREAMGPGPSLSPQAPAELGVVIRLGTWREREAWHDKGTTSGDALRAALAAYHAPKPPKGAPDAEALGRRWAEARNDHDAARASFLLRARAEAGAMLAAASRAYHAAWLAAGSS